MPDASPPASPRRSRPAGSPRFASSRHRRVSLCETLDRILNKGAVLVGEVTLAVADIDLIFLGLQLILTSVETARELRSSREPGPWAGVAQ